MATAGLHETATRLQDDLLAAGHDAFGSFAERAGSVGHDLRAQAEQRAEELEPVTRRVRIGAWQLVSALLDVVLAVPRLVVRLLGAVADTVDDLAGRSGEIEQRARRVAAAVPAPRDLRARPGARTAAWVGLGFAAGTLTGWLVARRCAVRQAEQEAEWTVSPAALPAVDEAPVIGETGDAEDTAAAPDASTVGPAG